jgi:peroxin-7
VSAQYHLVNKIPVHLPPPGAPPAAMQQQQQQHPAAMPGEVLTHDWNKYHDAVVATGGVDRAIRTFDLRNPAGGPTALLLGHEYAVRRLAWSPHAADVLLSASYDMTARLWTDGSTMAAPPPDLGVGVGVGAAPVPARAGRQLGIMNRHTEFVVGLDWCLFGVGGWVATVGWDERVLLWDANHLIRSGMM